MILTAAIRRTFKAADKARILPMEIIESLPCPRRVGTLLVATCFYYGQHYDVAEDAALLYTPSWGADVDWNSGEMSWIGRVEGSTLGFPGTRFDPVGEWYFAPVDVAARQAGLGSAVERDAEINHLYDVLVGRWWKGDPPGAEAARFRRLFDVESVAILRPGYLTLSADFFGWAGIR